MRVLNSDLKQQRGVAAIMFVLMLPVLLMFISLGSEGAHFLRAAARVGDAVEVASLALSVQGSDSEATNKEIAKDYIEAIAVGAEKVTIDKVIHKVCERGSTDPACKSSGDHPRFFQYELEGHVTYSGLFPTLNQDYFFGEEINPVGKAISRKYVAEAVDVIFVTDFSGSMEDRWQEGDNKRKIVMLKEVVKEVADVVESYTVADYFTYKNSMALVPFNFNTVEPVYSVNSNDDVPEYYCTTTQLKFSTYPHYNYENKVDYKKTVDKIFIEKGCSGDTRYGSFNTIEPTTSASDIYSTLGLTYSTGMKAEHGTASFEGIIRAAQLLKGIPQAERNPRQLIVVLSDGMDSGSDQDSRRNKKLVHEKLLKTTAGHDNYCEVIKTTLSSQTSRTGDKVKARLAAIGFGDSYSADENKNLENCVGASNVFDARNTADVKDKLIELISENIGRLYTPEPDFSPTP